MNMNLVLLFIQPLILNISVMTVNSKSRKDWRELRKPEVRTRTESNHQVRVRYKFHVLLVVFRPLMPSRKLPMCK